MSRNRNKGQSSHQVTIHMDPETLYAVEQYQIGLGLDSRADAVMCLLRAGISSVPLDAMVGEVVTQAVRQTKKELSNEVSDFFGGISSRYRMP